MVESAVTALFHVSSHRKCETQHLERNKPAAKTIIFFNRLFDVKYNNVTEYYSVIYVLTLKWTMRLCVSNIGTYWNPVPQPNGPK